MAVAAVLSWIAWTTIIINTNPAEAGIGGFVIFYLTLLLGLIGLLTILGTAYRVLILKKQDVISRAVRISFRHGVILGAMAVVSLALSAKSLLRWWLVILMIGVVAMFEYFFILKDEARRS
jgi:hypothetical protein